MAMLVPMQRAAFPASVHGLKLVWAYTEKGRTQDVPVPSQLMPSYSSRQCQHLRVGVRVVTSNSTAFRCGVERSCLRNVQVSQTASLSVPKHPALGRDE